MNEATVDILSPNLVVTSMEDVLLTLGATLQNCKTVMWIKRHHSLH